MSQSNLPNLPDHSRVWIYTSSREFTNAEIEEIEHAGRAFVATWKVHGKPLEAEFNIVYKRFVVIAANEEVAGVSGCSIDSSVKFIKEAEEKFRVSLLDKLNLAYHHGTSINVLPMMQFQQEIEKGNITNDTIVFNNMVENVGQMRSSWEIPLYQSWHQQLL